MSPAQLVPVAVVLAAAATVVPLGTADTPVVDPSAVPVLRGEILGALDAEGRLAPLAGAAQIGDTLLVALDWGEVARPAGLRLAPPPAAADDQPPLASWVRCVPVDRRAAGSDTIELLISGLGQLKTPTAILTDAAGTPRARLEPLAIEARGALEQGDDAPAPPRSPTSIGLDRLGLALVLAAGLLAIVAVSFSVARWWRRRAARAKTPEPPLPAPIVPPEVRARAALQALIRSGLLERGALKPYAVQLAEIGKDYVGAISGTSLRECTTEDCSRLLRANPAAAGHEPWMRVWLQALDLVKFAQARPPEQELRTATDALARLIDETAPRAASAARSEATR